MATNYLTTASGTIQSPQYVFTDRRLPTLQYRIQTGCFLTIYAAHRGRPGVLTTTRLHGLYHTYDPFVAQVLCGYTRCVHMVIRSLYFTASTRYYTGYSLKVYQSVTVSVLVFLDLIQPPGISTHCVHTDNDPLYATSASKSLARTVLKYEAIQITTITKFRVFRTPRFFIHIYTS